MRFAYKIVCFYSVCFYSLSVCIDFETIRQLIDDRKISKSNFEQVIRGMPKSEVLKKLGLPRHSNKKFTQFPPIPLAYSQALLWQNEEVRIIIFFDNHDCVEWIRIYVATSD